MAYFHIGEAEERHPIRVSHADNTISLVISVKTSFFFLSFIY